MSNDMLFRNYIVVKKYNILRYEAQGIYVMQLEICCFIERGGREPKTERNEEEHEEQQPSRISLNSVGKTFHFVQ